MQLIRDPASRPRRRLYGHLDSSALAAFTKAVAAETRGAPPEKQQENWKLFHTRLLSYTQVLDQQPTWWDWVWHIMPRMTKSESKGKQMLTVERQMAMASPRGMELQLAVTDALWQCPWREWGYKEWPEFRFCGGVVSDATHQFAPVLGFCESIPVLFLWKPLTEAEEAEEREAEKAKRCILGHFYDAFGLCEHLQQVEQAQDVAESPPPPSKKRKQAPPLESDPDVVVEYPARRKQIQDMMKKDGQLFHLQHMAYLTSCAEVWVAVLSRRGPAYWIRMTDVRPSEVLSLAMDKACEWGDVHLSWVGRASEDWSTVEETEHRKLTRGL